MTRSRVATLAAALLVMLGGCALFGRPPAETREIEPLAIHLAASEPRDGWRELRDERGAAVYVRLPAELLRGDLESARAAHGERGSIVVLTFNRIGAGRLAELTRENLGLRIAIVVGDEVVSSPQIRTEMASGMATIVGGLSRKDAERLAERISGMPAP